MPTTGAFHNERPAASALKPLPFSRWRIYGFVVTGAMALATAAALSFGGLNYGLDFTGGVLVQAQRSEPFDTGALRAALSQKGVDGAVVQLAEGGREALVRASVVSGQTARPAAEAIVAALGAEAKILRTDTVGAKVSSELIRRGFAAAGLTILAIALYVWVRFEAKFGWAALVTTLHDVFAIIGLFAVTGMSFDLTTIAALLAIAGYSINDTVIVFDRIRETLGRDRTAPLDHVIDRAVTGTLRRTLATSGTTLLTGLSLLAFGGPALFGFSAAICFGVVVGTYSSIFVAAPLLLHLPGRLPGRESAPPEEPSERDAA